MTVAYAPDALTPYASDGGGFVVELTAFSGPLDLLLSLIREEQVDIYDIPIARICEQFVVRIRTLGLNEAAEYLEMAARLLRIKAQMLLPRGDEEQWEDPRAELVRRLLEYQQMREVVDVLERRGEERRNQFARAYLPQAPAAAAGAAGPLARPSCCRPSIACFARRANRTCTKSCRARSTFPARSRSFAPFSRSRARILWTEIVETSAEPWQILSTLLGLLELAKLGELRVAQPKPFANVEISRDAASEAA